MKQLLLTDSFSELETEELAAELASILKSGDIVALYGPLGSGKTCFVRGLARGLNCQQPVKSPTFSLINEYPGNLTLYHIDFYRLENEAAIDDLGWKDYLGFGGIIVIEWAERVKNELPGDRFDVYLNLTGPTVRRLEITAVGDAGN
jgi:tRNA threonylcarbamoyladenosine biosynthesis protein TsaE